MLLVFITILSLVIRLWQIHELPGEVWGDLITHYEIVLRLLRHDFFLYYPFYGDGPFFSYFVAGLSYVIGLSFLTLKLATVIAGVALTVITYFLADEFFKKKDVSLISSFLTAISFWSISFSRQGKPHIFVPVFVALTLLFAMKKKNILAGIMLGIGMYVQAGFWGMMAALFTNIRVFVIGLLVAVPILLSFYFRSGDFFSKNAFYGEKLGVLTQLSIGERVSKYGENIGKNINSFYFKGDSSFRHTISGQPHIDALSAFFFTIGFIFIIYKSFTREGKKFLQYFLIPFICIQIPSIADINNPDSVPNMGRMIGILPLVYIATAYGIHRSFEPLKNFIFHKFFFGFFLGLIMIINLYKYFIMYPQGLPNKNVAFGKSITQYINNRYESPLVFLSGCCWGQWGQPEPNGIKFNLQAPEKMIEIKTDDFEKTVCKYRKFGEKVIIIVDPRTPKNFTPEISCMKKINAFMLREEGNDIGWIIEGEIR